MDDSRQPNPADPAQRRSGARWKKLNAADEFERLQEIVVLSDRSGVSAADLAQALPITRAGLMQGGQAESDVGTYPWIRSLLADLLRAELSSGGYHTEGIDPAHLAENPDFSPGYSLWFGEHFEVAYAVTGRGLNLVTSPQGMSPECRTHLAEAEARVIARLSGG